MDADIVKVLKYQSWRGLYRLGIVFGYYKSNLLSLSCLFFGEGIALSERHREVLTYIRDYVRTQESSPRLEEIAAHFHVTSPTAHKYLRALQRKGFLYFGRTRSSGFFIRLVERAGSAETVVEIPIAGRFEGYGKLQDFPEDHGHFATLLQGAKPDSLFAVAAIEDLPQANIIAHDLIIFDGNKDPQPGDICIAPLGNSLILIQVASRAFDWQTPALVMAQQFPIPANLMARDRGHLLHWHPLAYDDANLEHFLAMAEKGGMPVAPMPPEYVVGTALRLVRTLAF